MTAKLEILEEFFLSNFLRLTILQKISWQLLDREIRNYFFHSRPK